MANTPKPSSGIRRFGARLRKFVWNVPTGWLAGIVTGVFLAVTAAFGGLDTVQEPPIPQIAVGDTHINEQLSLVVERAVLIDTFAEAGAYADEGERVLSLVVKAENLWTEPLQTLDRSSVSQALRIDALGDVPAEAVARYDDATYAPWLQPGVPAELVVSWIIPEDLFADGDDVAVTIRDAELMIGQYLTHGASWIDPAPAATLQVTAEDVGAGAGSDDE